MQSALDGDLRNISFASLPTATKRLSSYINLLQQPNQQDSARDQIHAKMVAELDSDTGSGGLALVLARLELDIGVNDFVQAAKVRLLCPLPCTYSIFLAIILYHLDPCP
jgi:hypothetical protein